MKISLGSWAFSFGPYWDHPVPFEDTAKRLSEAGYDGIEVCGFPPHITLDKYPTKESREEVVRFLRDLNLEVSGYAADLSSVNPAANGSRTKYLDLFSRNIEMCRDIGSPTIRVDTVAAPGSVPDAEYKAAFHRVADTFRDAAHVAQQGGIRMAWEFEPGFLFNKPSEVLEMHQTVAHPNFTIMFDTSHAYMCGVVGARQHGTRDVLPGGVEEFLEKLRGRIGAIHLIDSDGTLHGDETSTHAPFGLGQIDFESLAPKLLDVPKVDWWTVDMCFWEGSWDLVESSREFLVHLLKHHAAMA
jgi:sugar phosphate isomerase/epimerase